jgi:hypothetical protein
VALTKGYGGSEPCEELRATIQEAEACSSRALQLASRKQVVSRRGSAAAVGDKRMGVGELMKFMEQVETLPCRIPEANILQVSKMTVWSYHHCASGGVVR